MEVQNVANISGYLDKIRTAIFGKDVRGSIHDGIDAINKETEVATVLSKDTQHKQTALEKKYDDQIANMTNENPSISELVDYRTSGVTGEGFVTAGKRADAFDNQLIATNGMIGDLSLLGAAHRDLATSISEREINVKDFGAKGNGITDDTIPIKLAMVYAEQMGATVLFPAGVYLVSESIVTNGVSMKGEAVSMYNGIAIGTRIKGTSRDFSIIKQGAIKKENITFNIEKIQVEGGSIGFDFIYSVHSEFSMLQAVDCNQGFNLGNLSSVGHMSCIFKLLQTKDCVRAINMLGNGYFNANTFIDCFFSSEEQAGLLKVNGGIGAVGNRFINTEFRSANSYGIELNNTQNTVFDGGYFENKSSAVLISGYSSAVKLSDCTFGSLKNNNQEGERAFVKMNAGGSVIIDSGLIYLVDSELTKDLLFIDAKDPSYFNNITFIKRSVLSGDVKGFKYAIGTYRELAFKKAQQAFLSNTINVLPGTSTILNVIFPTAFANTPNVQITPRTGESAAFKDLFYAISSVTATGFTIELYNQSSGNRYLSFNVLAQEI